MDFFVERRRAEATEARERAREPPATGPRAAAKEQRGRAPEGEPEEEQPGPTTKRRSATPTTADAAGTKLPAWASRATRAAARAVADFPEPAAPVMTRAQGGGGGRAGLSEGEEEEGGREGLPISTSTGMKSATTSSSSGWRAVIFVSLCFFVVLN